MLIRSIIGIIIGIVGLLLLFLYDFLLLALPYILGFILATIAICLVKKIIKNQELKKIVYTIIIIIFGGISVILWPLWDNYITAIPNKAYIKLKEIDDNQTLVGLTKEQAHELLENLCGDERAKITNYITFKNDFYYFQIYYDENGKVKSTSLRLSD